MILKLNRFAERAIHHDAGEMSKKVDCKDISGFRQEYRDVISGGRDESRRRMTGGIKITVSLKNLWSEALANLQ